MRKIRLGEGLFQMEHNFEYNNPGNPGTDLTEILAGVQALYSCRTEFKWNYSGEQPLNRFLHRIYIRGNSADCRIMLWSGFNVHGNVVQKSLFCQMPDDLRAASVRIQFDAQSKTADLKDEVLQRFWLKAGFSAADADSIENSVSFL